MSGAKIAILDYGIGNVRSIRNAILEISGEPILTRRYDEIKDSAGLIVPGVGAFGKGMERLEQYGLVEIIRRVVDSGRHVLGICLGMQMMLSRSFEYGETAGINLIAGDVREMSVTRTSSVRLPHVAWATLIEPTEGRWSDTLLDNGCNTTPTFYFVHSFVALPNDKDNVLAVARNGDCEFVAAVQRDNVTGTQFHPEKSGAAGLALLSKFVQDCTGR